ncbi:hypothetical protein GGTG_11434 [Gaeumannomyces tritici R3-111a-1]|uniref:Uncharacterized protein n=1 Tax=Gaeumannomyces tritici (strain R3-111a-1) TaxID=644352 RepID=J3PD65_GAET3|nr:hypothetical protein GGTG_11434 [Gaeumannomyces tritici R3-111a-1]EJT70410.1 hypothetical protein GGTG_11434 [Gaeumannomyces tritici R3-111a-1]
MWTEERCVGAKGGADVWTAEDSNCRRSEVADTQGWYSVQELPAVHDTSAGDEIDQTPPVGLVLGGSRDGWEYPSLVLISGSSKHSRPLAVGAAGDWPLTLCVRACSAGHYCGPPPPPSSCEVPGRTPGQGTRPPPGQEGQCQCARCQALGGLDCVRPRRLQPQHQASARASLALESGRSTAGGGDKPGRDITPPPPQLELEQPLPPRSSG